MTHDDLWELNYLDILDFMTEQKRRPSKHRLEEHQMLNWIKYQKKRLAQGRMKPERIERFNHLLAIASQYLRKNQYAYSNRTTQPEGQLSFIFLPSQKLNDNSSTASKT
ncbi:MAG: hypothetical protein IJ635_05550 [Bacteroidaceae bacterium]|nr:hypothetical protein [Bacteroidaceae bacterium]